MTDYTKKDNVVIPEVYSYTIEERRNAIIFIIKKDGQILGSLDLPYGDDPELWKEAIQNLNKRLSELNW